MIFLFWHICDMLLLGAFEKLQKGTVTFRHVYLSDCAHGTTRLPLDGFSLNLVLVYFLKICR
jgi:hypothetical protein